MEITAETIKAILESPERALDLATEQLDLAVHAAIGLYGSIGDPAVLEKVVPLYRHFMTRTHPARRLQNYQAMADRVIAGEAQVAALLPYLSCDDDMTIVSAAALDYAVLGPEAGGDPVAPARELLALCTRGAFANGPAVLGGLLLTGDRRILALLRPVRRALACEEIEVLIRCRGSLLSSAVVAFYLDWLEELDSRADADRYGAVAAGLANLALGAAEPTVYDLERVLPSTPEEAVRILDQWPLAAYAEQIAPRLRRLAEREAGEPIMPEVMAAWGCAAG